MRDKHSLDAVLGTLSATAANEVPADFMDGVWQRAGQLGEIADRRRRTALFVGLFVVGLGAGAGTSGWPGGYGTSSARSEEHTSELQSLMRISYAVFCLKKKKKIHANN